MNDVISQLVLKRLLTIEVQLTGGVAPKTVVKFKSGQVSKLEGMEIYGVEFVTATDQAISASGRAVCPAADAPFIIWSLVEAVSQDVFINKVGVTRFIPTRFNGYTQYLRPRVLNWTNSDFLITQTGTLTTAMSFLVNVFWKKPGE